ncbi:MAG: hypothetical protein HKM05_03620 [Spirochaetales bacterium]|nr:hypothetical protein [Spirochaetales bacterium]
MKQHSFNKRWGGIFFLPLLLLASCAPRITVLVSPEATEVGQLLQVQAKGVHGLENLVFQPDSSWPQSSQAGAVVRLTSTPAWNLPQGAPASHLISEKFIPGGFRPFGGLISQAQNSAKGWKYLPLFYDPVGVSRSFQNEKSPQLPAWSQVKSPRWKNLITLPGREPLYQQAVFFLANPKLTSAAPEWFLTPTATWQTAIKGVSAWLNAPCWISSSWQFASSDLVPWRQPNSPRVFVTTYRSFVQHRTDFPQNFRLWIAPAPAPVVAEVLSLESFTPLTQEKNLKPLLSLLLSPAFENLTGMKTHWIPTDQNTYEIDNITAELRSVVSQAPRWAMISNRLPPDRQADLAFDALDVAVSYAKKR